MMEIVRIKRKIQDAENPDELRFFSVFFCFSLLLLDFRTHHDLGDFSDFGETLERQERHRRDKLIPKGIISPAADNLFGW
ncbi:hypothetical protein LJC32_02470 [Oscillospiraceae bacterium OttesenSCG-928-F05]|nr:hypothetical protein [Oscillospiraceae bacterium OttesenSCG-928-F05]